MKIEYFGKSDKGRVRKANEDYFIGDKIKNDEYIFIVADGMGGHRAGDVASKLGTQTFFKHYKDLRKKNTEITDAMNRSMMKANNAILDKATEDPMKKGMGTTFSAMIVADKKAYIVHVGDSRIYLVRDDRLFQLTTDHTFVGKMVEEGRLTENEAREHPQKNILYMSLGARKSFDPELDVNCEIKENDIFVMCSDGLSNMVEDNTIKEYVQSFNTREAVEQLVNLANENGGLDNITLQVIRVDHNRQPAKTEPIPIYRDKKNLFSFFKKLFHNHQKMEEE